MARIRSIKPEFWDDRKLASAVSRDARLFYIGLWNFADEHSRANGDPVWLAGHIFPYESDIGPDECARYLDELARGSWVLRYTVEGDPYLFLPKLASHQRLEPSKVASKFPSPDDADDKTPSDLQVCEDPRAAQVFSDEPEPDANSSTLLYVAGSMEHVAGSMGVGAKRADKSAPHGTRIPEPFPITDDMRQWALAEGFTPEQARASTERFVDYWIAKPGKDGRKADWPATWRNWLRKDRDDRSGAKPSTTDTRVANTLAIGARLAQSEARGITP
jgi:hypothetical protein